MQCIDEKSIYYSTISKRSPEIYDYKMSDDKHFPFKISWKTSSAANFKTLIEYFYLKNRNMWIYKYN